jgi:hypothetical protein
MNIRLIVALFVLLLAIPVQGQHRRAKKVQRVQKISPEEQMRQEKLERMKSAMQKVMIIDSVVVDKDGFLKYYHLSPETGSIKDGDDFFNIKENDNCFVYLNEIGNKCYYSQQETDSTSNIFYRESADMKWSQPTLLAGINDDQRFRRVNYPYMMGDGSTLYFAADADPDGLGGYDIYMTTYDEEENRFLHPVNIGLPFNSEANDYLYVIDEYANLGWFATDRNQEDGKVCIYVFVPSEQRITYNTEDYTPEELNNLAKINSISDTWYDEEVYSLAVHRLEEIRKQQKPKHDIQDISFVINDDITYHQVSEFKQPENLLRFQQLSTLRYRLDMLQKMLDKTRNVYAVASTEARKEMVDDILNAEQEVLMLHQETHKLEKTIRNTENTFLTKSK